MDFEYGCSTTNKFCFLDENEVEDPSGTSTNKLVKTLGRDGLKRISYPVPNPLNVFELLTEQNKIYPPVIIGVAACANQNAYKSE